MTDPLVPLLELNGVAAAVAAAQESIFAVHRLPVNLRDGSIVAAEASIRAARASAGIDGANVEFPQNAQIVDPVLAGSLRIAGILENVLPVWRRAPGQALAKLHVAAASDLVARPDDLGRPRLAPEVARRLELLTRLLTGGTSVSGVVLTAVVHGELVSLRPFGIADGVIARAAARLTMIATGLDPKALSVPEVAWFQRKANYFASVKKFATGTHDGLRDWLIFYCHSLEIGAKEARNISRQAA